MNDLNKFINIDIIKKIILNFFNLKKILRSKQPNNKNT